MPYTDKAYFLTKISQTDLDNMTGGGVTGDSNLAEAIKSADSLIDSYIQSAALAVPLVTPPDMIKQISYDIATYNLYDRLPLTDVPERVQKKYDAVIKTLEHIAKKLITIPGLAAESKDQSIQYDSEGTYLGRDSY